VQVRHGYTDHMPEREAWAQESFEIATKIAYRNGTRIGIPKAGAMDCTMVTPPPMLPAGYVVSASRIADRRIILAGIGWRIC
jgi:hypothetical protein